jgi:hypothetical protein
VLRPGRERGEDQERRFPQRYLRHAITICQ